MTLALSSPTLGSIVAFAAVTAAVAVAEVLLRRASRRPGRQYPSLDDRQPAVTARSAQQFYERAVFVIAPAIVASAVAVIRLENAWFGVLVFACMVLACGGLWPRHSPIHLMPVARAAVRFTLPVFGICLALVPGLLASSEFTLSTAIPALISAWLIVGFGMWLEASFDRDRPIKLAVIGSRELAQKLAVEMRQVGIRGFVVVGYVSPEPEPRPDLDPREILAWLGELSEIREIVQVIGVDLLAVGPDSPRLQVFQETADTCLDLPVRMMEASAFYEDVLGHVPIGQINSAWFQCIMHPRYSPTSPASKRLLDLAVALPLGLIALPLIPILAALVKLSDGGPAIFRQTRVGEQGREFDIIKLRTMRVEAADPNTTIPKQDLITPLGRILRKTHLDELPQLINVIRGEMTLVGPRPEQPRLVETLAKVVPYYERRSLVKPGVTGWAQVRCGYAGTQVGTAWKICHDLYYVKRRSILFDLLILVQTLNQFGKRADQELTAPAEDFILGEAAGLVSR